MILYILYCPSISAVTAATTGELSDITSKILPLKSRLHIADTITMGVSSFTDVV